MKSFIVAALAANAAAQAAADFPIRYTGTGLDASGVTIKDGIINASGQRFWSGKPAQTACGRQQDPKSAVCESNDKNNKTTIFSYAPSADGSLKLDSTWGHGQKVYVAADGALAFENDGNIPEGGEVLGFLNGNDVLLFESKEWLSCPVEGEEAWQLFAQSKSSRTDCVNTTFKLNRVKETSEGGPWSAFEYI
ncbi:hypothetical protein CKM354_000989400 [Cercospora kikuchii]|uniref:Cell wall protein PhiA n=1 Tax=Cercospora kikuchii TaxID=84275 RepID=A0A9P3CP67_9PEZI|nr:uncharacterized protein CKM354_000989400 [Cercospora kikuchii]GIZ46782.1 hypothetical protein CKM354_000989400 [Cercospora kikuchii]